MILLIIFAFLGGVVTILSPCILPLLPIILSSSVDTNSKKRPLGVILGFIASFTFFTLFLTTIVRLIGIPADSLRLVSVIILVVFGLTILIPKALALVEQLFTRLSRFAPQGQAGSGFLGGLIVGLSLGLLWTPCVGPILASVISLALVEAVTFQAFMVTLAYATGTAIPMFAIMIAGVTALQKVPWLVRNTARIQRAFGVLMILTAVGILFKVDRRFQNFILDSFPNYSSNLTKLEDNESVKKELDQMKK
ncbi:cytochrome c biogenesis protein CcdA [Candidatus Woesebacteria bacterium]|nr:cytochrome c biogenesis protein CcdA [Candidatus Woesebacteria bacterium]